MASMDGLHRIGVFGSSEPASGLEKCSTMSKTSAVAAGSHGEEESLGGLRVSKHIMPSKQPSNPSLPSTLAAWTLSAFVKICFMIARTQASDYG